MPVFTRETGVLHPLAVVSIGMLAPGAWGQPVNDFCASPSVITGFVDTPFSTVNATTDGPAVSGCGPSVISNDVWFCWTSPVSGPVVISTCGLTSGDTVLAVYAGCLCPSLAVAPLACNDDACGLQSSMTWTASAGMSYLIRVGGYSPGVSVAGSLRLASLAAPPANDACTGAQTMPWLGTVPFDLTHASTDGPATPCGGGNAHNDVWFRLEPQQSGPLVVETCGLSTVDTVLAVYSEGGCPALPQALLACSDDACSSQSRVMVSGRAGEPLLIRVGGYSAVSRGQGQIRVRSAILAGPIQHPGTGGRYVLLEASSWSAAQAAAAGLGGNLVNVPSGSVNEFIRSSVLRFDAVDREGWIGLRTGTTGGAFVWQAGVDAGYRNWAAGEPVSATGNARFVAMSASGVWRTAVDGRVAPLTYGIVELTEAVQCVADVVGIGGSPGRDGLLTGDDFVAFVAAFAAGQPLGDVAGIGGSPGPDGLVTGDDFVAFIASFAAGCP